MHCVEADSVNFEVQVIWPLGIDDRVRVYETFASVGVRYSVYHHAAKYGQMLAFINCQSQHKYAHFIKTWHHYVS